MIEVHERYKKVVKHIENVEGELDTLLLEPMNKKVRMALALEMSAALNKLARKYYKQVLNEQDAVLQTNT